MPNLDKILLPVDFSTQSIAAGRYAAMLACRFQSGVTMLHVVPYEFATGAFEAPFAAFSGPELVNDARRRLDSFMTDEFRRIRIRRVVLEGDPAIRIIEIAHSEGVNLIVVGDVDAATSHDARIEPARAGH